MILDLFKVPDKVAIVTGAGRGIGAGIAVALAEVGADVVCAARTQADIEATAERVRATGRRALAVPTDVTERAQLEALVETTVAELGRLDILVNNAGGWPPQPLLRTSERAFEQALRFNVTSAFLLTRFAVPAMLETAGGGSIINISSRAGSMVQPGFTAYGTSKAALSFMTRNMAPELAPEIRVNAIELGGVETDALATVLTDESIRRQLEENTPMRRVGQVDDIAAFAVYLASPASSWVTGKVFEIDGGTEHPSFTVA
ncbi:MAG TPA: glucose 1-dehydrogenase [Acidimicrobiales bacterium]|nr:glucose 1-dehydrogenase [Acidimicrobiales bacterium]